MNVQAPKRRSQSSLVPFAWASAPRSVVVATLRTAAYSGRRGRHDALSALRRGVRTGIRGLIASACRCALAEHQGRVASRI